jgi:hypothetical protein
MHRRVIAITLLLATQLGCFVVRHEYRGDKLLTTDATVPGYDVRVVRHFQRKDRQFFWLHGGFPVGQDLNGASLAASNLGSHDAVVNLRLTDGQDLVDWGVTHIACVLSLLCGTWSVWVEGDVADLVPQDGGATR